MDVGLIDDMNSEGQASTGECGHVFTPRIVPKEGVVYMGQGIRHARTCPPCKAPSRRNPFLGGIDLLDSRPSFPVHTVLVLGHAPGYNPGLLWGRRLPRRTYILVRMALARRIRPGTGSGQPLAQRTHILVRMAWVRGPRSGIYPGIRSGQAILQRTPVLVRTVPGTTRTCQGQTSSSSGVALPLLPGLLPDSRRHRLFLEIPPMPGPRGGPGPQRRRDSSARLISFSASFTVHQPS